jgi:hypothetical protein
MKIHPATVLVMCALLGAAFDTTATQRGPDQDAACADAFSRSPAAATCTLRKAEANVNHCNLWASCRRDNGSFNETFGVFQGDRVYRVCNKDGKLVAGCPG